MYKYLFIGVIGILSLTGVSQSVSAERGSGRTGEVNRVESPKVVREEDDTSSSEPREVEGDRNTESTAPRQEDRQQRRRGGDDSATEKRDDSQKQDDDTTRTKKSERVREKLDDAKKKKCETRQKSVNEVQSSAKNMGTKRYERITKIYGMLTQYYKEKNVKVENYDVLVADIELKREAALAANQAVLAVAPFACTSDGPKADLEAFRTAQTAKIDALKAYRESVKKLGEAIKASTKKEQ